MFQRLAPFAVMLSLLVLAGQARAEDAPKADKAKDTAKAAPKATAADIARWVKDMDAEEFATREQAVVKLAEAGKAAIAPVAAAAKGKSLEVSTRSVSVLKKLLASKDESTKAAAKAALEELAKDEKHPAAHMAWQALEESKPPRKNRGIATVGGGRFVIGGAGGNIVINAVAVAGAGQMQISVKNVNGEKEIDVVDNGKKIKITEGKAGITVTVTDPPKGKEKAKPKQYKAADAKELKKKHPEAHKLYEKYATDDGAVVGNIRIGRVGAGAGGARAAVRPARIQPVQPAIRGARGRRARGSKLVGEAEKELDAAIKTMKAALDAHRRGAKAGGAPRIDLAKLIKQIEATQAKLAEARKSLGK